MGKIWNYSLRPTLKNPNFESVDELGKVCPNLSFSVENKIGNLQKIRLFTVINEIFHYPKLEEFINELVKIFFPFGKIEFCAHCEFYTYYRIFGLRKGLEYLYQLFDVLPKQATCEMKTV